jgi:hypothetical protein
MTLPVQKRWPLGHGLDAVDSRGAGWLDARLVLTCVRFWERDVADALARSLLVVELHELGDQVLQMSPHRRGSGPDTPD